MTRERETPPQGKGGAPESKSFDGDSSNDTADVKRTNPRWGDVMTCAMACSGRRDCSWCPYTCRLIGGES